GIPAIPGAPELWVRPRRHGTATWSSATGQGAARANQSDQRSISLLLPVSTVRHGVREGHEMVMLPGSLVWVPALSVTVTVKVNVAAVVGVPESPAGGLGSSVRPGGSCPAEIDQV